MVSNATGVLAAPTNFFAANSNLLNKAVGSAGGGNTNGLAPLTNAVLYGATNGATGLPFADTGVTNGLASLSSLSSLSNAAATALSVLCFGVTNDGVTDNTAALRGLLNQPGARWWFPAGRYLSQELQVTNNVTLLGNGATLVYANGAANTNIFVREMLNTNIVIDGLAFDGGNYSDITTRLYNGYPNGASNTFSLVISGATGAAGFSYWRPGGQRHGLQINAFGGGRIAVTVSGFGGCGIIPLATNDFASLGSGYSGPNRNCRQIDVSGSTCFSNFVGFYSSAMLGYDDGGGGSYGGGGNWITNYVTNSMGAQYVEYHDLNLWGNTIGAVNSAANCGFIGCLFNENYFHELNNGNVNDYHGTCMGNFYNHGLYCAIFSTACHHGGEVYSGCWFGGNSGSIGPCPIILFSCFGVSFRDCHFDSLCITNENTPAGGVNFFQNCTYSGTWAGNVLFGTDGQLLYEGNMSYDHIGDTDGSPLSLLRLGGNGAGITNISASANGLASLTGSQAFTGGNISMSNLSLQANLNLTSNFYVGSSAAITPAGNWPILVNGSLAVAGSNTWQNIIGNIAPSFTWVCKQVQTNSITMPNTNVPSFKVTFGFTNQVALGNPSETNLFAIQYAQAAPWAALPQMTFGDNAGNFQGNCGVFTLTNVTASGFTVHVSSFDAISSNAQSTNISLLFYVPR
jgi:hypothetical protein